MSYFHVKADRKFGLTVNFKKNLLRVSKIEKGSNRT